MRSKSVLLSKDVVALRDLVCNLGAWGPESPKHVRRVCPGQGSTTSDLVEYFLYHRDIVVHICGLRKIST